MTTNNLILHDLHRKAVALIVCACLYIVVRYRLHTRKISYSMSSEREEVREKLMIKLNTEDESCSIIRLKAKPFISLCSLLEREGD